MGFILSNFWITSNQEQELLDLGGVRSHIQAIIDAPEKFGTTREEIEAAYAKHGEKLGVEGKAREELILQVLKKGFIRIRLYPNKHWSITTHNWNIREKQLIARWAEHVIKKMQVDRYLEVKIVVIGDNRVIRDFTVEDLWLEQHIEQTDEPELPDLDFRVVKSVAELASPR